MRWRWRCSANERKRKRERRRGRGLKSGKTSGSSSDDKNLRLIYFCVFYYLGAIGWRFMMLL